MQSGLSLSDYQVTWFGRRRWIQILHTTLLSVPDFIKAFTNHFRVWIVVETILLDRDWPTPSVHLLFVQVDPSNMSSLHYVTCGDVIKWLLGMDQRLLDLTVYIILKAGMRLDSDYILADIAVNRMTTERGMSSNCRYIVHGT